jgi:putative effector of murein hydrolase
MKEIGHIWDSMSAAPAFGTAVTLVAFQIARWVQNKSGGNPLCNPVLIAIAMIILLLFSTDTSYATYFNSAALIHFLLGPATVALAIPLYKNKHEIRQTALPIGVAVAAGATVAASSAMLVAWALGGSRAVVLSLGPKSVTTPIAMGISAQIGAPEVTALIGARSARVRGLAAGVTGHGIATARMLSLNETAGAFSGVGMGLCGLFTALLLPLLLRLLWHPV